MKIPTKQNKTTKQNCQMLLDSDQGSLMEFILANIGNQEYLAINPQVLEKLEGVQ